MHAFELQSCDEVRADESSSSKAAEVVVDEEVLHEAVPSHLAEPCYVLTSDERLSAALEDALVDFQEGSLGLSSMRSLGLSYEALNQGACEWIDSNQHLADELLLVWSDFEVAVSDFIA